MLNITFQTDEKHLKCLQTIMQWLFFFFFFETGYEPTLKKIKKKLIEIINTLKNASKKLNSSIWLTNGANRISETSFYVNFKYWIL